MKFASKDLTEEEAFEVMDEVNMVVVEMVVEEVLWEVVT
jgi:hypothetical protein